MGNVLTGLIVITEENRNPSNATAGSTAGSSQGLPTGQYARITDIKNFEAGKKIKDVIIEGEGLNNVSEIKFNSNELKGIVNSSNTKITFTDTTDIPENNVSLKFTYTNKRGNTETKTYSFDLSFKPNTITIDNNGNFVVTTTDSKIVYIFKPIYSDNNETINEYELVKKITTLDEIPNTVKSIGNNIYIFTKSKIYTYDNTYDQTNKTVYIGQYFVVSDTTNYYLINNNLFVKKGNSQIRYPEGYSGAINQVVENDNTIIIIDSNYNVFVYNKNKFLTEPDSLPDKSYNSGKIDSLLPITIKTVFPNYTGEDFDVHVVTTGNTVKLIKPNYTTKKFEVLHDFSSSDDVSFSSPKGLVLDPKTGNAILCDSENNGFKEIDFGSVDAVWTQLGSDIVGVEAGDRSGWSISLSSDGKIVAIGAIYNDGTSDDINNNRGHVRVFEYIEDVNGKKVWTQLGSDIVGVEAADESGYSVSLSSDGKTVAIGAIYNSNDNGNNSGHVRVFEYKTIDNDGNKVWTQLGGDIDGASAYDQSGWSVSLSSDGMIVAIGAIYNSNDNGINTGYVRVFEYIEDVNGKKVWTQLGGDIDGVAKYDQSGYSVSLSSNGNTVAIGAIGGNDSNGKIDSGQVRVFEYTEPNGWTQLGGDIDGEAGFDESGYSVSLSSDGKTVAIGAPGNDGTSDDINNNRGHVRVFEYNNTENKWTKLGSDIVGKAKDDRSGYSVSLSSNGNTVAIGAPYTPYKDGTSDINNNRGHVRVYQYNDGNGWTQLGSDIDGVEAYDRSGYSVSLSSDGKTVAIGAIGAPWNDANGRDSGHVRVYSLIDNTLPTLNPYYLNNVYEYIYATDNINNKIILYKINSEKIEYLQSYGSKGNGDGEFNSPTVLSTISEINILLICDTGNNRVVLLKYVINAQTDIHTFNVISTITKYDNVDLKSPEGGLTHYQDDEYFLVISDTGNNRLIKYKITIESNNVSLTPIKSINVTSPKGIIRISSNEFLIAANNKIIIFDTDFNILHEYNKPDVKHISYKNNLLLTTFENSNKIDFDAYKFTKVEMTNGNVNLDVKNAELIHLSSVNTKSINCINTNFINDYPYNMIYSSNEEIIPIKEDKSIYGNYNTYDSGKVVILDDSTLKVFKPIYNTDNTKISNYEYIGNYGSYGSGEDQFNNPSGIAIYTIGSDTYYVICDTGNSRIKVIKPSEDGGITFNVVGNYGSYGSGEDQFNRPSGIAIHTIGSDTYYVICDTGNSRIKVIKSEDDGITFNVVGNYGSYGSGEDQFNNPSGIAIHTIGSDTYYVICDTGNRRIKVIKPTYTNTGVTFNNVGYHNGINYDNIIINTIGENTYCIGVGFGLIQELKVTFLTNNVTFERVNTYGSVLENGEYKFDPFLLVKSICIDPVTKNYLIMNQNILEEFIPTPPPPSTPPTISSNTTFNINSTGGNTITINGTDLINPSSTKFYKYLSESGTDLTEVTLGSNNTSITAKLPANITVEKGDYIELIFTGFENKYRLVCMNITSTDFNPTPTPEFPIGAGVGLNINSNNVNLVESIIHISNISNEQTTYNDTDITILDDSNIEFSLLSDLNMADTIDIIYQSITDTYNKIIYIPNKDNDVFTV